MYNQTFYAADGGRAGYADGMIVEEDDEEEFIRTGAGLARRQPRAFLNKWVVVQLNNKQNKCLWQNMLNIKTKVET